jgi:hypothetical protein
MAITVAAAELDTPFSVFDTMTGYPSSVPRQKLHPPTFSTVTLSRRAASFSVSNVMAPCTTTGRTLSAALWAASGFPVVRRAVATNTQMRAIEGSSREKA